MGKDKINKPTLIYLKKQMYYLLCNIPEEDILESEQALLAILQDDVELQAELEYKYYMEGE